jgi:antitoxin (DNA-binding transcriptional repressor) of toxin-antitoxin stability system
MVAERRMTEEELGEHLSEVLRDVSGRGERVEVTRDGVVVAIIQPPAAPPGTTLQDLIAKVGNLQFPGDGFGDDLERIQMDQEPIGPSPWDT